VKLFGTFSCMHRIRLLRFVHCDNRVLIGGKMVLLGHEDKDESWTELGVERFRYCKPRGIVEKSRRLNTFGPSI
jgi:hypothetical protein